DPVKLAGGINAYLYVPNPTGWVDPLGLSNCPGEGGCKPNAGIEEPAEKAKAHRDEPTIPSAARRPFDFGSEEKLVGHFEKHGAEFKSKNAHDYLHIARHVVEKGIPVHYSYKEAQRKGYVLLLGTNRSGQAKFAFVGTNQNNQITTLHTKSGKEFWRTINGDATDKTIRPHSEQY
ncbi:type IV secretion protein Rhs, partial [Pseudomonas cedrina subsp. fulgida]|nr:type IV secretion protein Rhs [Pseudomonas cedrina subsp. fulgida]